MFSGSIRVKIFYSYYKKVRDRPCTTLLVTSQNKKYQKLESF